MSKFECLFGTRSYVFSMKNNIENNLSVSWVEILWTGKILYDYST